MKTMKHKTNVSPKLQNYFPFREELSLQNGLVFKGEQIVVPLTLQDRISDKVHASHLGIQAGMS